MLTRVVDEFPKWLKIVLCAIGMAGVVFKGFLFVDDCIAEKSEKNIIALVAAIIGTALPIIGFVLSIIDLVSIATNNEFSPILR